MKIKGNDYKRLENLFKVTVNQMKDLTEYKEELKNDKRVKDVNMRLRWDIFWSMDMSKRTEIVDDIYKYANDDHLDTVLKKLVKIHV